MSDSTPNLGLPYIMPNQAQKHVTHNEALNSVDTLLHLAVADRNLKAPPSGPAAGDRYIVPAAATGEWAGHAKDIAVYDGTAWTLLTPKEGWTAWVMDEHRLLVFDRNSWRILASVR